MILDHAQITVAAEDVDATLVFYEKVLGLERIPKSNSRTGGWFMAGDRQLHVGSEASITGELNRASKRHVCFRVEDVDAEEKRLRDAGVTIIADEDPAPGWKRFYIRDPGGNRVEIAQAVLS